MTESNNIKTHEIPEHWLGPVALIWVAYAIACFTAIATSYSMVWHITSTTGDPIAITLVTVCAFLPQGLIAPIGGVVADRFNRKTILMVCYAAVVAIAGIMAVIAFSVELTLPFVMVYAALISIRNAFRDPAFNALMPMLVPEQHLIRINMLDNLLGSAAMILSPALGIFLYTAIGLQAPLVLLAVGSALSMLTLLLVKVPTVRSEREEGEGVVSNLASGFKALSSKKGLLVLLVSFTLGLAVYGPVDALLPLLVSTSYAGDGYAASFIAAMFGIGMLTGAVGIMVVGDRLRQTICIIGCAFCVGAGIAVMGLLPGSCFVGLVIATIAVGACCAGFNGPGMTLVQKNVDSETLGRAMGIFNASMALSIPMGTFLGGIVADFTGVQLFFVIDGIAMVLVGIATMASRSFKSLDSKKEAEQCSDSLEASPCS